VVVVDGFGVGEVSTVVPSFLAVSSTVVVVGASVVFATAGIDAVVSASVVADVDSSVVVVSAGVVVT